MQNPPETFHLYSLLKYPVIIIDSSHIVWMNDAFLKLHQIKKSSNLDMYDLEKEIFSIIHDSSIDRSYFRDSRYFKVIKSPLTLDEKSLYVISFFDISKRKALEKKLSAEQEMFKKLSEDLPDGIAVYKDEFIYSNPSFEKLVGYSGKELLSLSLENIIVDEQKKDFHQHLEDLLTNKIDIFESIIQIEQKKSKKQWVRIKTKTITHSGDEVFLSIINNISLQKFETDKLYQLAFIDTLTGIYNRRKFNEILEREYQRTKRYHVPLCGLFFDIDHFKSVNDTHGHDTGDIVLKTLAQEVKQHIRESDFFARWGGEEFIILLPESDIDQVQVVAENLRIAISNTPFPKVKNISISIGITKLKENERIKSFLKRLDNALYIAKKEGRNRSVIL